MKPDMTRRRAVLARQARSYIRAHHSDPDLSLVTTAAALGGSPRQVQRSLAQHGDGSFRHYLLQVRVAHAVRLLASGMPAYRVAPRVGYRGPSGLRLALLRSTGKTAADFQPGAPEYI